MLLINLSKVPQSLVYNLVPRRLVYIVVPQRLVYRTNIAPLHSTISNWSKLGHTFQLKDIFISISFTWNYKNTIASFRIPVPKFLYNGPPKVDIYSGPSLVGTVIFYLHANRQVPICGCLTLGMKESHI